MMVDKYILNNSEEYEDPDLYDLENESYTKDVPLLMKWAVQQGGPVIELACGTGRVTIPIAQAGIPMIGVDITPPFAGLRLAMVFKRREQILV